MQTATSHHTVDSADGTRIGFTRTGSGPAVVLVDGAFCYRGFGPSKKVAAELEADFTVYMYDRRGRGESGNAGTYAVEREIEDLAAVIAAAGGSASLVGFSSGGALALETARQVDGVEAVAAYEIPFVTDPSGNVLPDGWLERLEGHAAAGERSAAAQQAMRHFGTPAPVIAIMRLLPLWKRMKSVAPTLPHDFAVLGDTQSGRPLPRERFATIDVPALVLAGGKSPEWIRAGARALADLLPDARYETLPGQTHMVKAKVVAPAVRDFLAQSSRALALA